MEAAQLVKAILYAFPEIHCLENALLFVVFAGDDLTEKIRKIKIVFTPTICKQTCQNGHCYNNCEKGDTTTLYSQGGHDHDPKSGFRICESSKMSDPFNKVYSSYCFFSCEPSNSLQKLRSWQENDHLSCLPEKVNAHSD